MVRFIEIFQPLARFIPTVSSPERKVSFNEKLFWTAMVLIGYLIMTEIPLYGVGEEEPRIPSALCESSSPLREAH